MSKTANRIVSLLLALVMALSCVTFVAADAKTVNQVATEIEALSANANDYTAADKAAVEALKADYDALSADDQATLDSRTTHTGTGQPLGRVLESALWTVWSFAEADNSTTLADGTYNSTSTPALTSQYSKGKSTSSRQKAWSVKQVEVTDGKAYATIAVASDSYTAIMLHGTTYPKTNTTGNSEFANVPVDLNSTFYFNGVSSSMSVPIAFSLTTTIEEPAAEQQAEPERTDLAITNNTDMFKALTAQLETEGGKTTLVMALSSAGYRELFKGTYEQAVANGAATDNWIHGATNADGKWEFRIPLAEGETYVPVVAISNSYYTKYLNGQNSLARAFYPRQFTIDYEAKTIVTGDYAYTQTLDVTNNVNMFSVSAAALNTVGGPNSNNYAATLTLTMGSTSFDKAFVGRASAITDTTETIALGEGNTFVLPVKWVKEFGNPDTLESLLGGSFVVSFHSKKKDAWYERQFTVSEANGTLTIDNAEPERTDLAITNNTDMFKALTAQLETEGGKTTLVMALSSAGYRELFKGTYEQAVANGAATDNWIHGATNADGKWEFRIPLAEGETYVPVVAISNSYYTKYLNGQNSLARAFYPRQFTIDYEAKTIVTGDYAYTQTLDVTNNVNMFSVSAAALNTVGGPNSNNYAATLTLTMGSTSFDKAFVGRASAITDTTETIALGEGNTFVLPVKWVKEFGNPDTLESLLGGSFVVSFHSKKKDAWYERQFTVSEADGKLTIDEAPPEAVTVEPGTQTLEQGVCYRFGEGTFTLSGDPTVYQGGQEFYVSATGTYTVTKGR